MECHRGYSRCSAGYRTCPARAVLCCGCNENLWKFCRSQATRAGVETVYPLCHCQRCSDLWIGTDDGTV